MEDIEPTEEHLLQIEEQIRNLSIERGMLIDKKKELELELSNINIQIKVSGYMPDKGYAAYASKQMKIKADMHDLQGKISEIKYKIQRKQGFRDEVKNELRKLKEGNSIPKEQAIGIRNSINNLRLRYLHFSSDTTRVASMRSMAAKFSKELEDILKTI